MTCPSHYQAKRRNGRRRGLRLESLETRRLLAVLTVDTNQDVVDADDGMTSLREAITTSNDLVGRDEIVFDFTREGPATIRLEHGELQLTDALTITGVGPELLSIDAQQKSRIFHITADDGDFSIQGVTLINGRTEGSQAWEDTTYNGGAIRSITSGTLIVHNSVVRNNSTVGNWSHGGGLFSEGNLAVSSSTISDNSATGNGGGVHSNGHVSVTASTISGNSGGGIWSQGEMTISSSTISGNSSVGIRTNGHVTVDTSSIADNGSRGIDARDVTVNSSTISGNAGGGIRGADVTVGFSTISRNFSHHLVGYYYSSGGIAASGKVTVSSSTISGNSGGGISGDIGGQPRHVTIEDSILAGNGSDLPAHSETLTVSHSLIGSNRGSDLPEAPVGSPDARGNLIGGPVSGIIDPLLGPLSDNGGPTFTHALLQGSPAIDAGNPLAVAGNHEVPLHDQRGAPYANMVDGNDDGVARIDMGAHERQNLTAEIFGVSSPTLTPVDEVTIRFARAVSGFDLGDLRLSLNGGDKLFTGEETLASSDNQTFVLSGMANAATMAGYYTLMLMPSGSGIMALDGGPLDSGVSTSWAMGRSILGLTVDTLTDETDGRIDDGDVSLRDAIAAAAPGETIDFDASLDRGTIQLTLGELSITRPLTIDANELATGLVIDAMGIDPMPGQVDGQGSRIFEIDDGDPTADSPVTIRGLTLTGAEGSAIHSEETLSIESASVVGNLGDGVDAWADVNVNSSTISDNSGRGIIGHVVTVTSSTISGNDAFASSSNPLRGGGGIAATNVTVSFSTISGNSAPRGGGISAANVTVTSSAIWGNTAVAIFTMSREVLEGWGGGIAASNVTVNSSTISGNSAWSVGGISASNVTVNSSTISGNSDAGDSGGGISTYSGHVTITNSIVAGNSSPDLKSRGPSSPDFTIQHSLIGDNWDTELPEVPVGSPDANGNLIGGPMGGIIDPLLGPLADNGGPTFTHVLLQGSPAIDAGDPTAVAGSDGIPQFDQRGAPYSRVGGERIDMGAFESGSRPIGDSNRDGVFNSSDLVMVFQAGKYEDERANNATFDEGDWNGDGDFNSSDLVFAFQAGSYVSGATPLSAIAAVLTDQSDEPLAAGDVDGVFQLDDELLLGSDL